MCSLCALLCVSSSNQVVVINIAVTCSLGLTYKSAYVHSHKLHILFHSHKHRLPVKSYLWHVVVEMGANW